MILTTQRLVERAASDPAAFAELYESCFPAVFHYIQFRCRDGSDAEDLTALVFEKVLRRLAGFSPGGAPFEAWLFAIARNTVTDWQRRQRLRAALAQLSERERDLVGLRFASGLKNCEIARVCRMEESHVAVMIYRALRKLRTLLVDGLEVADEG